MTLTVNQTQAIGSRQVMNVDVAYANSDMPYYFRSSTNRSADKRTNQALMQKIHNELSDLGGNWVY